LIGVHCKLRREEMSYVRVGEVVVDGLFDHSPSLLVCCPNFAEGELWVNVSVKAFMFPMRT
jgi:hypothetical protein